jgi:phosphohistidine phosphatase
MKLLVVRHAHAEDRDEWSRIHPNDELRPLTKKGIKQFVAFSKVIVSVMNEPDLILTSPLTRAVQTSDILKKRFKKNYRIIKELKPEASCIRLLKFLSLSKKQNIIIVGHEPFLSELVSYLVAGETRSCLVLKKGGFCLLDLDKYQKKRAKLEVLMHPKIYLES